MILATHTGLWWMERSKGVGGAFYVLTSEKGLFIRPSLISPPRDMKKATQKNLYELIETIFIAEYIEDTTHDRA